MNTLNNQPDGTPTPMHDEILQALIGKVIDLGTAMHDNTQQLKKLTDQQDTLNTINHRTAAQEQQFEQLIKYSAAASDELKRLNIPTDKIDALQQELKQHAGLFEKPLAKSVHYRHYIGWPILVIIGLLIITCASVGYAISQYNLVDKYVANDTQWRKIKLTRDTLVYDAVRQIQAEYLSEPHQMLKDVKVEEVRREILAAAVDQQRKTQEEIDELKRQEKKR